MHVNWKAVARTAAAVGDKFIPGVMVIEQMAEAAESAPTNKEKAARSLAAAVKALEAEGQLTGKQYATPRVQRVLRSLNDDTVELLNALAEADAAPATVPNAPPS